MRQFYDYIITQEQQDKLMGEMEEDRLVEIINEKWNSGLVKMPENSILDFRSSSGGYYVEIKSRRNRYNQYPTTMVGYNKIRHIIDNGLNCIFVFAFTDGDYYYTFNPNDEFEVSKGGRNDRGRPEYNQYWYIPIVKLIKL